MISTILLSLFALSISGSTFASEHLQHIPIEGYSPKLKLLGQHVELKEIPTKVIRITKTVAVKIPVPYPVKIPHKVPYPVHVSKPYPVPVPQIVKVPEPIPVPISSGHGGGGSSLSLGGSEGFGGSGYASSGYGSSGFSGSEHYEESQQVANPVAYQQDGSSFQGGDVYEGQGSQSYQLEQESYIPHAEASQYQHVESPVAQESSQSYQQVMASYQNQGYNQNAGVSQ